MVNRGVKSKQPMHILETIIKKVRLNLEVIYLGVSCEAILSIFAIKTTKFAKTNL